MTRVAIFAPDDVSQALMETATLAGVDAVAGNPVELLERSELDAIIIGLDFLSLRIVAMCDDKAVRICILMPQGRSSDALSAFGFESGITEGAGWSEILKELALNGEVTEARPVQEAPNLAPSGSDQGAQAAAGHVIAVWGPTGAPGRTVVAINVAAELALAGNRVLVVDADTYGGAVAGYLELFDEAPGFLAAARMAHQGVLDDAELARVGHVFSMGKSTMSVLSGTVSSRRWPELTNARIRCALDQLRERFDAIVVDVGFNLEQDEEIVSDLVGPRRNQATLEILRQCDTVLAVAGADVIGIARFIHCLDSLREVTNESDVVIVANKVRSERGSNASVVRHTLARFAGLEDVAVLNYEPTAFASCLETATPLCMVAPKSAVRNQIRELAQSIRLGERLREQVTY
ncbi:MAG: hypothetical protein RLZZ600_449 [Actinomycetota bacterium]